MNVLPLPSIYCFLTRFFTVHVVVHVVALLGCVACSRGVCAAPSPHSGGISNFHVSITAEGDHYQSTHDQRQHQVERHRMKTPLTH